MEEKNFKRFLKREAKSLAIPLMMIVLGALFIAIKSAILSALVTIVGVLLIVGGVALGLSLLSAMEPLTVIGAAILVLMGIICVTNAFGVSGFILMVIGICIFVNALFRIFIERSLRGSSGFKNYLINDIITAILGVVLMIMPKTAADAFFVVVGIFMVILGISNIISSYLFYKNGRYVNDGTDVVWEEKPR